MIDGLAARDRLIVPDLRDHPDSDRPYSGYGPRTIAPDMLDPLAVALALDILRWRLLTSIVVWSCGAGVRSTTNLVKG